MALVLILFPLAMACLALSIPSNRWRPLVLPVSAFVHSVCTFLALLRPEWGSRSPWLVLDPVGALILVPVSTLFLFSSIYAVGYLGFRQERSNRVFTACLSAFLGLISLAIWSHHLGTHVGRHRGNDARHGAAHLLQPFASQHRSHMEIPSRRIGGDCPGPARNLLPRLFVDAGRAGRDADLRGTPHQRAWHVQNLAQSLLHSPSGGLRHQDGARSHAHMETRRLWRGSGPRRRYFRGRRDERGLSGPPADIPDSRRRGGEPVRLEAPGIHGPVLHGRGRHLHGEPEGFQAHARLLQRRAHGHPGPGSRDRGSRALRNPPPRADERHDQGRALPVGG